MSAELDAKLQRLEARIAATRRRLDAMTDQERMEIGDFLESISDRFAEEEETGETPKDPARFRR